MYQSSISIMQNNVRTVRQHEESKSRITTTHYKLAREESGN
jgi:hypothetical protein